MHKTEIDNVEDYIKSNSFEIQDVLFKIRNNIFLIANGVEEYFSYGMPSYKLKGQPLIYFGVFKNHIGLYAAPSGHSSLEQKLAEYKQSKGSIQFPLNKPIPFDLIAELIDLRVKQINGIL